MIMKKKLFVAIILVLLFSSCSINNKAENTNLTNINSLDNTWALNTSNWQLVQQKKPITIDDKVNLLQNENEIKLFLNENKNIDFLQEVPRIESYYTDNAFFEFYIFNSIKDSDINECNKILNENNKQLCKDIFNVQLNEEDVITVYSRYDEDEIFAKNMYKTFTNIKNKIQTCDNDEIILYLSCKKILNKDFDVEKVFLNYSRFQFSDFSESKKYYKEISEYWLMDDWFKKVIEEIFAWSDELIKIN